jgi:hypothetical protein
MTTDAPPPDGEWATVQAENANGLPLILRVRTDLSAGEDMRAKWPGRMSITWTFGLDAAQHGLPTADQQAAMDRFEDAAISGIEQPGTAVLTTVATTSGAREWVWYCGATQDFTKALNAALKGHPKYPLQLRANPDPAWAAYRGLLRAIGAGR